MTDGRRARGDQRRAVLANQAAALASLDGLGAVSIARVAEAVGAPKSSVQASFRTKQDLQLAAVRAASETFVREVITPAQAAAEGLDRLTALVGAWFAYVERRVFPGGCFMVANLAEFDSHEGPVRDALAKARRQWLRTLERQAQIAIDTGTIDPQLTAAQRAFEIDALLAAANLDRNLQASENPLLATASLINLRLRPNGDNRQ
jgi:AcrR family transcriptional regulator